MGHATVTHEQALDAVLVRVRGRLIERANYLRARGTQVSDRYEAGELPFEAVDVMLGAVLHDVAWLSKLVDEIDGLRAEVGVRRAAEKLG